MNFQDLLGQVEQGKYAYLVSPVPHKAPQNLADAQKTAEFYQQRETQTAQFLADVALVLHAEQEKHSYTADETLDFIGRLLDSLDDDAPHSTNELREWINLERYHSAKKAPSGTRNEEYRAAYAVIRQENNRLADLFKKHALTVLKIEDHPKAQKAWSLAYDWGHAHGYSDVLHYLEDLAELLKDE